MKKTRILLLLLCVSLLLVGLLTSCTACNDPVNPPPPDTDPTEKVKVTMVGNNGSADSVSEVEKNKEFTLPTPTREGYEFDGWYTSADLSGLPVTSVSPSADTTVYAKWAKLYTLTLDAAGGKLGTTSVTIKAGEKLLDKLASLIPEKEGCLFGMWTLDGKEVTADSVMGEKDLTLTAKYKVKYTVEIFVQNDNLDGYTKSSETVEGYACAGEEFKSEQTVKGYTEVKKADSVTSLVISEDSSKNVFRHYFDKTTYSITFVSNYPDGSADQMKSEKFLYGTKTKLPFVTFEADGYYLEGWATEKGGALKYFSHVMDDKLFNGEAHTVEELTVEGDITLYAVWSKGYTDLFGGADILYIASGEKNTVYLNRGGLYFKGILKDNSFIFADASTDFPGGCINSDGETFLFYNASRAEVAMTLFVTGKGLDENVKLYFDKANGVKYSEKNELSGTTVESTGEFFFDENGYMVANFNEGPLKGTSITFIVGQITINGEKRAAFQVRNEDDIKLGQLFAFVVKDGKLVPNTDDKGNPVGDITLNGFGTASYNSGSQTASFYYSYDKENGLITLTNSQGSQAGVLKLMTIDGKLGYMIYTKGNDIEFTLADGSTLKLDGIVTATYTKGNTVLTGFFSAESSVFGGTILTFTDQNGDLHKFMLTTKTEEVIIDGNTQKKTSYIAEILSEHYKEFYYKDSKGTYYAPLFVFNSETTAFVYGYNSKKEYHKLAYGTLTYNKGTGTYTFTVTETYTLPEGTEPVFTDPVDFTKIKSCVMRFDEETSQYKVNFWFSYTDEVGTTDLSKTYTGSNGETLTLVGGFAIYTADGKTLFGIYKEGTPLFTAAFTDGTTLYFEIDEENGSFVTYKFTSTIYYQVGKDGNIQKDRGLLIDYKSKVTYLLAVMEGEAQKTLEYPGKLISTGETSLTGFPVYLFESDENGEDGKPVVSFKFIMVSAGSSSYLFIYDAEYDGTFTSTNRKNGVLMLDGFGFAATYTDSETPSFSGMYQKNGNNVTISNSSTGKTYNFYVEGDKCALRSDEYGKTYVIMDNQVFGGLYATLDGLGGAKIFTIKQVDEKATQVFVDENATYTLDGDYITLNYKDGNKEHTVNAKMGTVKSGSNHLNALHTLHDEVVHAYVNEDDWSVLRIHNDGTATKHLINGAVETGTYSLVTESLLYYVNDSGSEAYIYVYDTEKGTATPRSYTAIGYFTKDLGSLLFTEYGFAVFNNSTRYYYTVENGKVTLYHLDENAENHNRYGYVEEDFGELSDVKNYGGETYYKNDGFAITFVRDEATKDEYPLLTDAENKTYKALETLKFAPTGGDTFSVTGQVTLDGKIRTCYVVKTVENGKAKMYIRIGYYYFDIEINYQGDGVGSAAKSTYTVKGLRFVNTLPSYQYLTYLYYFSQMTGSLSSFPNEFGTIAICIDFDKEGKETESYINAEFGKYSGYLYSDGSLITKLNKVPLTYLGNNFYRADFTGEDGLNYSLIFTYSQFTVFSTYGYRVYVLNREETVKANDGYEVTVSRVIASEANISAGSYFSFGLSKDGVELESYNVMLNDGKLYYVVRTTDENGKIISTDYYQLDLIEKSSGSLEGEGEGSGEGSGESKPATEEKNKALPVYESAKVTKTTAETVYTEDGKYFVDILPENKVLLMGVEGDKDSDGKLTYKSILIAECSYDAESSTYTLKDTADNTYTVTIKDGKATVTVTAAEKANA